MANLVQCPYCGSYNTAKTSNGKMSDAAAKTGAVLGGALLSMVTGGILAPGLGANLGYGRTWHQYCCHECHEVFKVRLSAVGYVKEIRKY